jgi:FHS family L-fucose permease-like MFS transporter
MSIMYPTHFALGIHGLGEKTKLASSWMVTAVVGGAIMPIFMGWLADTYSMRIGFVMPLLCFCFVAFYGFSWRRLYRHDLETVKLSAAH